MGNQLGLKFDFFIALGSASPEWQMSQIRSNPSIVSYVEGYNESDRWWQDFHGATGVAATRAVQQYIYADVKNDPNLAGVGVIQASFADPSSFSLYGDMAASADNASTHTYFGTGNNPSGSEADFVALAQLSSPGRPTITTEAGYHTTAGNVHGVSQLVQAKYILDLLFEQAKLGVELTYLWELADNYADPGNTNTEDHFGLFNNDWTPKLAALALHNTMQIMADPGTGGHPAGTLDYAFDDLPNSVRSSLYQKSDGTFVLVVWNDVRLSGPTVQGDLAVAPIATTLRLGQSFAHVAIFDPLTGTASVGTSADTSTIGLQVLDHPLIIELSQDPAFTVPSTPIAAPDEVITNPLEAVLIDGLAVSAGTITVRLQTAANGLSVLDTAGHLLALGANDVTLSGTLATVNAELATVTYTGGSSLGSDLITATSVDAAGLVSTRTIPVLIQPGTTATNSGGPALSAPATFAGFIGTPLVIPRVTVADTFAASHGGTVSLTISDTSGRLLLPETGAALFGNGSNSLIAAGSFAQIAAALAGLTYTGAAGATQDRVAFQVIDQEGFSSSATTAISVQASTISLAPDIPAVTVPAIPPAITAPTASATPVMPIPPSVQTMIASTVAPVPTATSSDGSVFRFFDNRSGTQFLTASAAERDAVLTSRPDLVAEGIGIGAIAQPAGDADAIAVYRFFDMSSGTHFYTSSGAERDGLQASRSDLKFEGVSFYEHASAAASDTAVYRFFNANNGTHFYTASGAERSTILATRADLVPEGVAFYAPAT